LGKSVQSGITRRLARVIFLQLLFISLITILGVVVAAKVVEGVMMRAAMEGEAEHFWTRFAENPDHALPNTDNLLGYLKTEDGSGDEAGFPPAELEARDSGYGRVTIDGNSVLVLVDKQTIRGQPTTLYLVFDEESVSALSFYFGVVPLSLVLIVIYLAGYIGFRHTRAAVSPVVALANSLRSYHPKSNQLVNLGLSGLQTTRHDDEINVLVNSLNEFTDEINELIDRERRFTRDASHELKTPLTVIQGSAEFLAATVKSGPNQQRTIERILRTVRDMNELVNALLILARGNNKLPEMCEVSINDVVDRQLEQLKITHNQDEHVRVRVEHRNQVDVTATPQFADAVIGNLLRNAFNYTRQGEVHVTIDNGTLEVRNRGEGMQPVDADKLFEPFVRGEDAGSATGYGVGLDIVKRLCELFGWSVQGHYSAEKGMVFTVKF